jgi:hypothetical protein
MDALSDHLDNYETYGVPRPNAILCDNDELERNKPKRNKMFILSNVNYRYYM